MKVYVLTAEVNGPSFDPVELDGSDYHGTTSVHATRLSALSQLDNWLCELAIDPPLAHMGRTLTETFIGNDVALECPPGRLNWGINEMEVQA